jgi:hypothetical protein
MIAKRPATSLGFRNIYQIRLKIRRWREASVQSHALFDLMIPPPGDVPLSAIML